MVCFLGCLCMCESVCAHVSEGWSRGKEIHVNVCMYVCYVQPVLFSAFCAHCIGLHIVLLYTPC